MTTGRGYISAAVGYNRQHIQNTRYRGAMGFTSHRILHKSKELWALQTGIQQFA
jgi:hypothetical protein